MGLYRVTKDNESEKKNWFFFLFRSFSGKRGVLLNFLLALILYTCTYKIGLIIVYKKISEEQLHMCKNV